MALLDRLARRALNKRLQELSAGQLLLHDGDRTAAYGRSPGLTGTVHVHDPRLYGSVVFGGHVGAAEAFAAGWWSSPNVTDVVRLLLRNRAVLDDLETGWALMAQPLRRLIHAANRNTIFGSMRNIRAHYDLGNEFFRGFLDETLTYSCGIFERPDSTLRDASEVKYDRICRKLALGPRDHVIEIGGGWGGFALHAASRYGCSVTTTTISNEQFTLAHARVDRAGLQDRIRVLNRDYRDLTGTYDKLVSIEMIEAVGHHYYETFFRKCAELLSPNGAMALQAITIQDQCYDRARREVDFIKRYIFPGSCIPSAHALSDAVTSTDLRLVHAENIGPHYAETLRRWRRNLVTNWPTIRSQGFTEEFGRLWQFYFSYCEGAFEEGALGDLQLVYIKPAAALPRRWPAPLQEVAA